MSIEDFPASLREEINENMHQILILMISYYIKSQFSLESISQRKKALNPKLCCKGLAMILGMNAVNIKMWVYFY